MSIPHGWLGRAFGAIAIGLSLTAAAIAAEKPRLVVMTDIGGDPDDEQSLVRFLLYTCDFDLEGLCTGFGHGHYQNTRPELLHKGIDAYGEVLANLRKHRPDYPSREQLKALVKDGHNGDPHSVGPGMDSEASEWIVRVLERDDPRPVWFSIWGGPRELAQALWKLEQTRPAEKFAGLKQKIRVHSIADQDRTAGWIKEHHPDVFWIFSDALFRGIWREGDQAIVSPEWLEEHVRTGHGPLGACYPAKASGKAGVKEGDTPSFLYVVPNGLSDPDHPEWGNWGGRFQRDGERKHWLPAYDQMQGKPDMLFTIHRWREHFQNEFQARMDWCVKPFDEANHPPLAVVSSDRTRNVLRQEVAPQTNLRLSAAGSSDPDGDRLAYRWWIYREPGSFWDAPTIEGDRQAEATIAIPPEAAGRTIHLILEVTDNGSPPLVAYRRIVLSVTGEPVPPPAGTADVFDDSTPITTLPPPTGPGTWQFFRGVNLNGPAITIDGNRWEGDSAAGFSSNGKPTENAQVTLRPPTNPDRASMIRTFRWGRQFEATLRDIPKGQYAVYAYVWEETAPEVFDIAVNGSAVVSGYTSGSPGQWRRLGPWNTTITTGKLTITARGGAANFSGIEIWRQTSAAQQ